MQVPPGPASRPLRALAVAALLALLGAAPAAAAPPPNDGPRFAAAFEPYTAANGVPQDQQALAELVEATPEQSVPRCLGKGAFERTVWYRVPATEVPQEVTVEAIGRTIDVIDLAAFVQREGANPIATQVPNACSGQGAGGSDAGEEPTAAVTLQVPARRDVLIQVGRRGPRGTADDERVLLSLTAEPLTAFPPPPGDFASPAAPRVSRGPNSVRLGAATITEEDPVQAPCPSLATVWRRVIPNRDGHLVISVAASRVSTLTVFSGRLPSPTNALDCVVRSGFGSLAMRVRAREEQPLWVRLGTDRPPVGATATLRVSGGDDALIIDGGPGGFDPTTGGPAGGFPGRCSRADAEEARVTGPRFRGFVEPLNRTAAFPLDIRVERSPVCDVELELVGPRGQVYAGALAISLSGRKRVELERLRRLRRGTYRLRVTALSEFGDRVPVRTSVSGRLKPMPKPKRERR
jgi:hypothetical protein